jgi:hypothetical protein
MDKLATTGKFIPVLVNVGANGHHSNSFIKELLAIKAVMDILG